jgi:hypothetical protein
MKYIGWFITDEGLVLGLNKLGHSKLLKKTKRGIPCGALQFESQKDAERELELIRGTGQWPLFAPHAKVEQLSWK